MATDPDQLFEFDGPTYDWIMERFHVLIAKASLLPRYTGVKELHQDLIDLAFQFDRKFDE
jgi:hypothetical protein